MVIISGNTNTMNNDLSVKLNSLSTKMTYDVGNPHIITKINDNINIERTIAESMNAGS